MPGEKSVLIETLSGSLFGTGVYFSNYIKINCLNYINDSIKAKLFNVPMNKKGGFDIFNVK